MAAVHFDLAAFPTTETIKMLTNILVKITRTNDRLCNTTSSPDLEKDRPNPHAPIYTCFHARSIPTIDIHSYLSRILKYTPCANEVCFVIYAVSSSHNRYCFVYLIQGKALLLANLMSSSTPFFFYH